MKSLSFALLAMAMCAATAQASEPNDLIKNLAEQPVGMVVGHTCSIRGAVWAYGPKAGVNVELVGANGKTYPAQTTASGAYALDIPYSKPTVYRERVVDPIRVPVAYRDQVNVHASQVVCDHRVKIAQESK